MKKEIYVLVPPDFADEVIEDCLHDDEYLSVTDSEREAIEWVEEENSKLFKVTIEKI